MGFPSRMDNVRLMKFQRVCQESTNRVMRRIAFSDRVSIDLELSLSEVITSVVRYLYQCEDFEDLMSSGYIHLASQEDDETVSEDSVDVPICEDGVKVLNGALRHGAIVRLFLMPQTKVGDVISFVKGIEQMGIIPTRHGFSPLTLVA